MPLPLVVSTEPALNWNVLVVSVGAIAKFNVPLPDTFTFKVSVAEPPPIAFVVMFNTSLPLVILMVSLVVPLLGKVMPPLNVSPAVPLSNNTPLLFKVIALASVALAEGAKFNSAPLTVTLPVPIGPLVMLPGL